MVQGTLFSFETEKSKNGVVECEIRRPYQLPYFKIGSIENGVLAVDIYNETDANRSMVYGVPSGIYGFRFRRNNQEWSKTLEVVVG